MRWFLQLKLTCFLQTDFLLVFHQFYTKSTLYSFFCMFLNGISELELLSKMLHFLLLNKFSCRRLCAIIMSVMESVGNKGYSKISSGASAFGIVVFGNCFIWNNYCFPLNYTLCYIFYVICYMFYIIYSTCLWTIQLWMSKS